MESFNQELKNNLINNSTEKQEFFEKWSVDTLNQHAPVTKNMSEQIMRLMSQKLKERDNEKIRFTNYLF